MPAAVSEYLSAPKSSLNVRRELHSGRGLRRGAKSEDGLLVGSVPEGLAIPALVQTCRPLVRLYQSVLRRLLHFEMWL